MAAGGEVRPYDPSEWSHGKRIAYTLNPGETMPDVHTITAMPDEPEPTAPNEPTPAAEPAPAPSYTFKAGEIVLAEGDTAYSFTDATNFEQFDLTPIRRAVMVARLRMTAQALEDAGDL